MKRIMVLGAGGMTGSEVSERAGPAGWKVRPFTRADLDISDQQAVEECVQEFRPYVVINCAAYTAVDRAESEPDAVRKTNVDGARNVARAAQQVGAVVVDVSSDYVFDGKAREPYSTDSATAPLGVYGQSKLDGEYAVREENPTSVIVRTSWVFSHRGANFVRTMLRLGAAREEIRVVNDQRGRPTCASDLADALLAVADALYHDHQVAGIYHFANAGETTWFDFAQAIFQEASSQANVRVPRLVPITTAEYPTAATRPLYSVLDTALFTKRFKVNPRPWPLALRETVALSMRDALAGA